MRVKFFGAACLAIFAACPALCSQTNALAVGDSPPPLAFETILQAPGGTHADWPDLKGKIVILEFWATWCIPCIRAMPHLNELADALKNDPVQFIAISDEPPEIVTRFLERHPIHAWIGLNTDKSLFTKYGVNGIPYTVVVDPKGKIAAITRPADLTEEKLRDLLAGKPLNLSPQVQERSFSFRPGELLEPADNGSPALFRVSIRPSETLNSGWGGSGGRYTFIGSSVVNMLCAAYGTDESRMIANTKLPGERYDAVVNVPTNLPDAGRNWLRLAVEGTFGLSVRREIREMETLVLRVANPKADHLTVAVAGGASSSQSDVASGEMQSMNVPISSVVASLQGVMKAPVIDETGLTNRFDWSLKWDAKSSQQPPNSGILRAVREQLGLELTPAKRRVEVVVVDKVN